MDQSLCKPPGDQTLQQQTIQQQAVETKVPTSQTIGQPLCKPPSENVNVSVHEQQETTLQPQVIKIECQSDDEPMEDNFTGQMFIDNESGEIEALTIAHNPQPRRSRKSK